MCIQYMDCYDLVGVKEKTIAVHCVSEQSGSVTFFFLGDVPMAIACTHLCSGMSMSMKLHGHDFITLDSYSRVLIMCEDFL